MRKICFLVALVILLMTSFVTAHGEQSSSAIAINGKLVQFTNTTGYPFIDKNSRTQVPFRVTLEAFGAKVDWVQSSRTAIAEKDGIKVEVPIGAKYIIKNGEKVENDTEALIVGGKTYLPIRKVMEALGCEVTWGAKTGKIDILSKKKPLVVVKNYPKNQVAAGVYYIPADVLGESKLSDTELRTIKGNVEEMRKQINTVSDLIRYLRVNGYTTDGGDTKTFEGNYEWHHNRPSWSTIKLNKGNCGATASFANFILRGKYDEVGFINHSAYESGHIYNYIKQDGKIYIVDFLQYLEGNRSDYNLQTVIEEIDSFEQFATSYINRYRPTLKYFVRYTADEVLPIANTSEKKMMYFQKGANVTSFYETPEIDFVLKFTDPPTVLPNWD